MSRDRARIRPLGCDVQVQRREVRCAVVAVDFHVAAPAEAGVNAGQERDIDVAITVLIERERNRLRRVRVRPFGRNVQQARRVIGGGIEAVHFHVSTAAEAGVHAGQETNVRATITVLIEREGNRRRRVGYTATASRHPAGST